MSKSPVYQLPRNQNVTLAGRLSRVFGDIRSSILRLTAVNELEHLTDRQLRDIGVDRNQIEQVAAREIAKLHAK